MEINNGQLQGGIDMGPDGVGYGPDGFPLLQSPQQGALYANKSEGFLKWLFSFTSQSLDPLENEWRGLILSDNGDWVIPRHGISYVIMNEDGIHWCISLLKSYFNPVFFVTNMPQHIYNFHMRKASRVIILNLTQRHKEFGLKTSDIWRVVAEMETKISAILGGALNDGYRIFLSTQNQNIEHSQIISNQNQGSPGIFKRLSDGIFKKEQGGT